MSSSSAQSISSPSSCNAELTNATQQNIAFSNNLLDEGDKQNVELKRTRLGEALVWLISDHRAVAASKRKKKQQYQRPEEYETNVCQGMRSPGSGGEKQQKSVPKKLGDGFPHNRRNDVSHCANNNGGGHKDYGTEDTITKECHLDRASC
jgi:hypothetical protein